MKDVKPCSMNESAMPQVAEADVTVSFQDLQDMLFPHEEDLTGMLVKAIQEQIRAKAKDNLRYCLTPRKLYEWAEEHNALDAPLGMSIEISDSKTDTCMFLSPTLGNENDLKYVMLGKRDISEMIG